MVFLGKAHERRDFLIGPRRQKSWREYCSCVDCGKKTMFFSEAKETAKAALENGYISPRCHDCRKQFSERNRQEMKNICASLDARKKALKSKLK